jgi:hypothetical protein
MFVDTYIGEQIKIITCSPVTSLYSVSAGCRSSTEIVGKLLDTDDRDHYILIQTSLETLWVNLGHVVSLKPLESEGNETNNEGGTT